MQQTPVTVPNVPSRPLESAVSVAIAGPSCVRRTPRSAAAPALAEWRARGGRFRHYVTRAAAERRRQLHRIVGRLLHAPLTSAAVVHQYPCQGSSFEAA